MASEAWGSYPSIFALGHKHLAELFSDEVLVEEKVDGSQFSFGKFREFNPIRDQIRVRSKGVEMLVDAPEKMFQPAVDTVLKLADQLHEGWVYRAEYLRSPHHNALSYSRIPAQHLIVFDIATGLETYLPWEAKAEEAARLGLEVVPRLYQGKVDIEMFRKLLETTSVLGGVQIEGCVVKNYARFGLDKKILLGKYVSEAYKEVQAKEWKTSNPTLGDIFEQLIAEYRTPARWMKAVTHLRDAGKLEGSPRDIGLLFKEVPEDVRKECEDEIKEKLFKYAWPRIQRGITAGIPSWYKDQLLAQQFDAGSWGTQ
jgi:hypothetical protein